jgi:hypothetical protein
MNISFTEIDNLDNKSFDVDNYNQNPYFDNNIVNEKVKFNSKIDNNYKSILKKENVKLENQKTKKKSISYGDILSSMNTVVIDGKLQFVKKENNSDFNNNERNEDYGNYSDYQEPAKKIVKINNDPLNNPINPNIKNSYIYNKYFKNYKENELIEEPKIPKTKKELLNQLIINSVHNHNERIRLSQVKSTKLLFNANTNFSPRPKYNPKIHNPNPNPIPNRRILYYPNPNGNNHLFNLKN